MLKKVLSENVGIKTQALEIALDEPIERIGIDSVAFVRLIVAVEAKFGVEFEDQYLDFRNLTSLSKILICIDEMI